MAIGYELDAVRRFVATLDNNRKNCCNEEGMYCSDLDARLTCHLEVCQKLFTRIFSWKTAVFRGQVPYEAAVEAEFKNELERLTEDVKSLVDLGQKEVEECYSFTCLDMLERYHLHFVKALKNWSSPRKSVAPGPRTAPTESADRQIRERLQGLAQLPKDWRPSDPSQISRFRGQRG